MDDFKKVRKIIIICTIITSLAVFCIASFIAIQVEIITGSALLAFVTVIPIIAILEYVIIIKVVTNSIIKHMRRKSFYEE